MFLNGSLGVGLKTIKQKQTSLLFSSLVLGISACACPFSHDREDDVSLLFFSSSLLSSLFLVFHYLFSRRKAKAGISILISSSSDFSSSAYPRLQRVFYSLSLSLFLSFSLSLSLFSLAPFSVLRHLGGSRKHLVVVLKQRCVYTCYPGQGPGEPITSHDQWKCKENWRRRTGEGAPSSRVGGKEEKHTPLPPCL